MAITWRNVVGPSLADAARPFELARQGLNESFNQLGQLITQRQEQQQTAAKEGFLDMLYKAATPEELEAMQRSGQLNEAIAALDPRVRAQVRGQADARLAALRDAATKGFAYQDTVEDRNTRDARAAAEAAILRGDPGVNAAISALPARFQAPLLTAQDARGEVLLNRDRSATRFTREGEKHKSDMEYAADRLKTAAAQRGMYAAQAGQAGASTALARLQIEQARNAAQSEERERERAMVRTGLVGDNSLYKGFTTPEKNVEAVTKIFDARFPTDKEGDRNDNLRQALSDNLYHTYTGSNGKTIRIPVPLSILETAAQTASVGNGLFGFDWDATVSKNFSQKIKDLMKQHETDVLNDYGALMELKRLNIENPPATRK